MVPVLNALLYLVALCLALTLITPLPADPSPRQRALHAALTCGGAVAITAAIGLTLYDRWLAAIPIAVLACVLVGTCMRRAFAPEPELDDGDDEDDGGSARPRRPIPPAPPAPDGPEPDWSQFDRVRSGWERQRDRAGVA